LIDALAGESLERQRQSVLADRVTATANSQQTEYASE